MTKSEVLDQHKPDQCGCITYEHWQQNVSNVLYIQQRLGTPHAVCKWSNAAHEASAAGQNVLRHSGGAEDQRTVIKKKKKKNTESTVIDKCSDYIFSHITPI